MPWQFPGVFSSAGYPIDWLRTYHIEISNVGRRRWLTFEVGQIVADRGKIFLFCSPVQSSLEP